ncbi:FHA domain-containing protein [Pseudonocardia sp. TRM90224]|uniref:FHA domain-containing protein n=1 Tax=Pseudonocardia sp. TRM90224 TaxID=2812678 RepID=UPI001E448ED4|nr:FHA domain-containing protein [Pseudonocardia sp. TRM90224]
MNAFLEVWRPAGADLFQLDSERITVGRAAGNDIVLADDGQVSRVHAVLEKLAGTWSVRDVSSRNGTFVNGTRVSGEARLGAGDELRIGRTRIVLRAERVADDPGMTEAQSPPPQLTPRERDVLIALFKPMTGAEMFTEPASTRQIAQALWVSEAAVKQHLLRLYDKFGVGGEGERRRTRLANEALRRGAITLAEVRAAEQKG